MVTREDLICYDYVRQRWEVSRAALLSDDEGLPDEAFCPELVACFHILIAAECAGLT
jgi:hypothetical protein